MNAVIDVAETLHGGLDELSESAGPVEILAVFEEHALDGEVYLVGDEFRAKVCFSEGRLAWVYCSTHPVRLTHTLHRELGLPRIELERSVLACRETGQRFGEYLVNQGLVDHSRLRRCLRRHQAEHLHHLALAPGEFELAVVPQRHRYDQGLTFDLDEVVSDLIFQMLGEAPAGLRGRAVVDLESRRTCACEGEALDPEMLMMAMGAASTLAHSTHLGQGPQLYRSDRRDLALIPAVGLGRFGLAIVAPPNFLGTLAHYAARVAQLPLFAAVAEDE